MSDIPEMATTLKTTVSVTGVGMGDPGRYPVPPQENFYKWLQERRY